MSRFTMRAKTADGYTMTGQHICAPRDNIVHSYSDCPLSLIGKRTILVPSHGRGHFVLAPGELIHKPARPDGWERGIARTTQRLRQLVERERSPAGKSSSIRSSRRGDPSQMFKI